MAQFYNTSKQLTLIDIKKLEATIHFTFPESYKEHILQYNGGEPTPNIFEFIEDEEITSSDVDHFLGIEEEKGYKIEDNFIWFKMEDKRMPDMMFPIAEDSGGNQICMDAADEKIYFWDHETEVDYSQEDDSVRTNLYLVANSLQEFLDQLRPWDISRYVNKEGKVCSRKKDFQQANQNGGYKKKPKGYIWHHHQEPGRMQLVAREVHARTPHKGGYTLARENR